MPTERSMRSDGATREIGRNVGGLTTEIHLLANIERIPLDFSLSPGQVSDVIEGEKLISKNWSKFKTLLADKAYDADNFRESLKEHDKDACILPKSNRKNPAFYDRELYEQRAVIENMFGRLKDWRGIAMRFSL